LLRIETMSESVPEIVADDAGPLRRCIASERSLPPEQLIRFVVAPDGSLTPDLERRLPGRGMWVAAEKAALEKAVAKNLFSRAARQKIAVPEDLPQRLQSLLLQRVLDTLGLARRAGQAVAGHDKVQEFIARNGAGVLMLASDAGNDARNRSAGIARGAPVIRVLDAVELGAAFAREQAVFAVVAPGKLAQRLTIDSARLTGLRGLPTALREQV
jgi:predicted RNA-binding protein YlxR (DUF448 family)